MGRRWPVPAPTGRRLRLRAAGVLDRPAADRTPRRARLLVATISDDDVVRSRGAERATGSATVRPGSDVVGAAEARLRHRRVADLDRILRPGDLLVVNDTKVLAARLNLRKRTGGAVEVLLLEPTGEHGRWQALVRPGKRVAPGPNWSSTAEFWPPSVTILADGPAPDRHRPRRPRWSGPGRIPLPPYIHDPLADADALPDRLRPPTGVGGGADRRPAPHRRGARPPRPARDRGGHGWSCGSASAPSGRSPPIGSTTTTCTPSATRSTPRSGDRVAGRRPGGGRRHHRRADPRIGGRDRSPEGEHVCSSAGASDGRWSTCC